jgi:hypothetical protein
VLRLKAAGVQPCLSFVEAIKTVELRPLKSKPLCRSDSYRLTVVFFRVPNQIAKGDSRLRTNTTDEKQESLEDQPHTPGLYTRTGDLTNCSCARGRLQLRNLSSHSARTGSAPDCCYPAADRYLAEVRHPAEVRYRVVEAPDRCTAEARSIPRVRPHSPRGSASSQTDKPASPRTVPSPSRPSPNRNQN